MLWRRGTHCPPDITASIATESMSASGPDILTSATGMMTRQFQRPAQWMTLVSRSRETIDLASCFLGYLSSDRHTIRAAHAMLQKGSLD
mmetsp:Transcript_99530/g.187118  ORF Transcript_99530/g.187118 Transcript_99530/m.187118 type:complete len:89 (-) Transcript_99530:49-315(-)